MPEARRPGSPETGRGRKQGPRGAATSSPDGEAEPHYPPVLWVWPLIVWAIAFNVIASYMWPTWNFGPRTFVAMIAIALLLVFLRPISSWLRTRLPEPVLGVHPGWVLVALSVNVVALTGHMLHEIDRGFRKGNRMIDLSVNTYTAGRHFLASRNPYASPAQVFPVEPGPDVTPDTLYGVPYHHGFPYYPLMFLSFIPFRFMIAGFSSIRLANVILLILNLALIGWLSSRMSPRGARRGAALLGCVAYLCPLMYGRHIFSNAMVDIVISTYSLAGFAALHFGRSATAGVLFGLSQACKLLPGPLLVLPFIASQAVMRARIAVLAGYLGVALLIIAPFALWDPSAFVSATFLFYLIHFRPGDGTSLWSFLPEMLRPAFIAAGVLLTLLTVWYAARRDPDRVLSPIAGAFLSFFVFIAFSRVSHVNHIWSIYPLGCVVLAASSVAPRCPPAT